MSLICHFYSPAEKGCDSNFYNVSESTTVIAWFAFAATAVVFLSSLRHRIMLHRKDSNSEWQTLSRFEQPIVVLFIALLFYCGSLTLSNFMDTPGPVEHHILLALGFFGFYSCACIYINLVFAVAPFKERRVILLQRGALWILSLLFSSVKIATTIAIGVYEKKSADGNDVDPMIRKLSLIESILESVCWIHILILLLYGRSIWFENEELYEANKSSIKSFDPQLRSHSASNSASHISRSESAENLTGFKSSNSMSLSSNSQSPSSPSLKIQMHFPARGGGIPIWVEQEEAQRIVHRDKVSESLKRGRLTITVTAIIVSFYVILTGCIGTLRFIYTFDTEPVIFMYFEYLYTYLLGPLVSLFYMMWRLTSVRDFNFDDDIISETLNPISKKGPMPPTVIRLSERVAPMYVKPQQERRSHPGFEFLV
ncbi:hypothetical protein HK096_002822 [Nowakowskiella sp. JEL0078]|nr:hypothetical protein HK096_002822 [Nowakowskiella sp. JEL0078]